MNITTQVKILAAIATVVVLGAAVVLAAWSRPDTLTSEYPDPPFERLPADHPRIVWVKEDMPVEEKKVTWKFHDELLKRLTQAEERDALQAVWDEKYVRARGLAEKVLQTQRDSVVAAYVLARVHFFGERNPSRALYYVRAARHLVEARGHANAADADARVWYLKSLDFEIDLLAQLAHWPEWERAMDLFERIYQPVPWQRYFPLVKQGRLAESEQALDQAEALGTWRNYCSMGRAIISCVRNERERHYELGKLPLKTDADSAIVWSNYGEACQCDFRFAEARQSFEKAISVGKMKYFSSPYLCLTALHLQMGDIRKTWDALDATRRHRATREPYSLDSDQAWFERTIATFLLTVGRPEQAAALMERAMTRPDRLANHTDDLVAGRLNGLLLQWMIAECMAEQAREVPGSANSASGELSAQTSSTWIIRRQIMKLLHDEEMLIALFRPQSSGPKRQTQHWLLNGAAQLLPPGIAERGLELARQSDTHPGSSAYYDACGAELALLRGDDEESLRLAQASLAGLPLDFEQLLAARVAAIGGEAARRMNRETECMALWNRTLADFPAAFRLLKLAVPVNVTADDSPAAQEFVRQLLASPRVRSAERGFALKVSTRDNRLHVELRRSDDQPHCQVELPLGNDSAADARNAVARFHQRLMSPQLDLTQVQICSLLGSTSASHTQAEIDRLLDPLKPVAAAAAPPASAAPTK